MNIDANRSFKRWWSESPHYVWWWSHYPCKSGSYLSSHGSYQSCGDLSTHFGYSSGRRFHRCSRWYADCYSGLPTDRSILSPSQT